MKLTENFIKRESTGKVYDWGDPGIKLKGNYKNEVAGEVTVTRLSKEEMEEYIKN